MSQQPTPKKAQVKGREWRDLLGSGIRRCEKSPLLFQLRIRVGPLTNDSVNFGIYPSEYEAARVRRHAYRMLAAGMYVWAVLRALKEQGDVPADVWPRWVYRREDGRFGAKLNHGRFAGVHLPGPYETPEDAHDAMRRRLRLPPLVAKRVAERIGSRCRRR